MTENKDKYKCSRSYAYGRPVCVYSYGLLRAGPYEYVDHIRMLKIKLYFHEANEYYKLFQ